MTVSMLGKWLGAIKYVVAVATAIFVGRHRPSISDLGAGELPDQPS